MRIFFGCCCGSNCNILLERKNMFRFLFSVDVVSKVFSFLCLVVLLCGFWVKIKVIYFIVIKIVLYGYRLMLFLLMYLIYLR